MHTGGWVAGMSESGGEGGREGWWLVDGGGADFHVGRVEKEYLPGR